MWLLRRVKRTVGSHDRVLVRAEDELSYLLARLASAVVGDLEILANDGRQHAFDLVYDPVELHFDGFQAIVQGGQRTSMLFEEFTPSNL